MTFGNCRDVNAREVDGLKRRLEAEKEENEKLSK